MTEKPLLGKTVLVTRARDQSQEFVGCLEKRGAETVSLPTIKIVPPRSWDSVDRAIDRLDGYDWIVFTSVNGVNFFWRRMAEKQLFSFPRSLKVCTIGPATTKQVEQKGARVDYMPREYVAEAILQGFEAMAIQGKRILLARVKKARDILPQGLRKMGARVDVVETYRTIKPGGGARILKRLLDEKKINVVTFTSSSTVNHLVDLLKKEDVKKLLEIVVLASSGPVTTQTLRTHGLEADIQAHPYTIPGLTQAIVDYFVQSRPPATVR